MGHQQSCLVILQAAVGDLNSMLFPNRREFVIHSCYGALWLRWLGGTIGVFLESYKVFWESRLEIWWKTSCCTRHQTSPGIDNIDASMVIFFFLKHKWVNKFFQQIVKCLPSSCTIAAETPYIYHLRNFIAKPPTTQKWVRICDTISFMGEWITILNGRRFLARAYFQNISDKDIQKALSDH